MKTKTKKTVKRKPAGRTRALAVDAGSALTDSDLLNWLDKQGAHYGWTVQLPSDYPNVRDCVFVCRNTTGGHKTIREAIAHRISKPNKADMTTCGK